MNYTLYCLALHPQIQEKVHIELDTVLGPDVHRPITFSDLSELKYLEMCIKESLRVYPPVPFIMRHIYEDIPLDEYEGKTQTIPAGSEVMILINQLHKDPSQFPQPELFNPDRFLAENCIDRHPYAFIPFSAGPRNCLGMKYAMVQMKTT